MMTLNDMIPTITVVTTHKGLGLILSNEMGARCIISGYTSVASEIIHIYPSDKFASAEIAQLDLLQNLMLILDKHDVESADIGLSKGMRWEKTRKVMGEVEDVTIAPQIMKPIKKLPIKQQKDLIKAPDKDKRGK